MKDIKPKKMSLEDYLAINGVSSPFSDYVIDKLRGNRQLKTQRGRERFEKNCDKHRIAYAEKRNAVIDEYYKLVEEGKIIPKTLIEKTIEKANGHPDNASTQAARRMCEKRGIDWRKYNE